MTVNTQSTVSNSETVDKEINFERLRKQYEQEKSERQRLQQEFEELKRQQLQREHEKSRESHKNDVEEESDEPYVDHRTLSRKLRQFEENFDKKVEQKAEEKAKAAIEATKQQDYVKTNSDFYTVLTQENIQKFAESHPAIAERMLRMPDTFDRQALLYEQIKAFEKTAKEPEKTNIQDTIRQNQKGPFYHPTGIGNAPYNQVGDFSEAGKKNAWDKMQELKLRLRI